MTLTPQAIRRLRAQLDPMLERFDYLAHRAQDPVELVWRYEDPRDQELAALVASGLAYGRVALVRDAVRRALDPLGPRPAQRLAQLEPEELEALYHDFVYRMTRGPDLVCLLRGAQRVAHEAGSLDAAYGLSPGHDHVARASAWVKRLWGRQPPSRGLRYLLPDPGDGGASKRLHLFFRWVTRGPDAVDLGIWRSLEASSLLMPLDTHTARICAYLGLTTRKSVDGKMVEQISQALRQLDAQDPLKYDFALCHLGISKSCIHRRSEEHCPSCPLEPVCVLGNPLSSGP